MIKAVICFQFLISVTFENLLFPYCFSSCPRYEGGPSMAVPVFSLKFCILLYSIYSSIMESARQQSSKNTSNRPGWGAGKNGSGS